MIQILRNFVLSENFILLVSLFIYLPKHCQRGQELGTDFDNGARNR